jgi:hypothetical protein
MVFYVSTRRQALIPLQARSSEVTYVLMLTLFLLPSQIIMFSDLECDYINPIDLCNKLNQVRIDGAIMATQTTEQIAGALCSSPLLSTAYLREGYMEITEGDRAQMTAIVAVAGQSSSRSEKPDRQSDPPC